MKPGSTERAGFALLTIEMRIKEGEKALRANAQVRSNAKGAAITALPPPPPAAVVEIEPALVAWDQASASTPKIITVRASVGGAVKITNITSSKATFATKTEASKELSEYRITVTPQSTAKPELAFLSIELDSGTGTATQRAYVQIASSAK